MLASFLEMNYKNPEDRSRQENLFKDLKVYKENRKFCDKYMGRYPVISLSLKDTEGQISRKRLTGRGIAIFAELARKFNFLRKNEEQDTLFLGGIQDFFGACFPEKTQFIRLGILTTPPEISDTPEEVFEMLHY
ncbi:hypothetical protein [Succinimonas amylolytica]|uniref:hypothetical protein n=1 Tax=Succinimonas amylolytica TaxID=83769 RepID=UPI0023A877B8